VSVLTAANGFAKCVCAYVSGPAHVNTIESLVKYLVCAIKKGIEQLVLTLTPFSRITRPLKDNSMFSSVLSMLFSAINRYATDML